MQEDIPRIDLSVRDPALTAEVFDGWRRLLEQGVFLEGEEVKAFEREFAQFTGARACVTVGTGTDALELALRAVGVAAGDQVVVPANTYVASALAVLRVGAIPILVDADPEFLLMDVDHVAACLGPRTKAVMPVHLYGQLVPMDALAEVLVGSNASLVEDAAQSHGASRFGQHAGAFGRVAATSFYPTKNLGAMGTGGAVLTNEREIADAIDDLRADGFTSRLDAVQAVALRARLRRLAHDNERRQAAAARYGELLRNFDEVDTPSVVPGNEHVWHLYVVRVPRRDRVLRGLHDAGVQAGVHYPVPLHLHRALRSLEHARGAFPVAEAAAESVLSLPFFPGITPVQQERVVDALRHVLR